MGSYYELSPKQRETLRRLKRLFGESGYVVCDVRAEYMRHPQDFLAYDKDRPNRFVVVRPTRKGRVSITPFLMKSLYGRLPAEIRAAPMLVPVSWSDLQLRHYDRPTDWWEEYFPEGELRLSKVAVN